MVEGSVVSPTASLMELSICSFMGDSCKAVVLVLPQWRMYSERYTGPGRVWGSPWAVNWSWKGVGITLDSRLVLEGCEHLGGYSSEVGMTTSWCAPGLASLKSITELGERVWRDTQAWKGWGTLVWVDSTQAQTIAGVWLGSVFG